MKFVKQFWDKWDQKRDFGEFSGGFPERKPILWASQEQGARWASRSDELIISHFRG